MFFFKKRMPEFTKKLFRKIAGLFPANLTLGRKYWKIRSFIDQSESFSKNEIDAYQLKKIKEIVSYAYENVPGYRMLYEQENIKPKDLQSLNDFKFFPTVSKELIRDNLKDFTSTKISIFNKEFTSTGGSSGIPFGFFRTKLNNYSEPAYIHSGWKRSGWTVNNKSVVLRGEFVGSRDNFSYFNEKTRELLLSSYYLMQETYEDYIKKISKKDFKYLHAYPSSAFIFADLIIENDDCGRFPFEIILLGSENIYNFQIEKIKKAFPLSKINHWYGHSEQAILAQMCEFSEKYHISPTYGYTEILDSNFNEVSKGFSGKLVGTSFWNYATPFIRYVTDDIAQKGEFGCKKCGRQHQLIDKIEGRKQEIIISKKGRYISMAAMNMHTDVFKNVAQFQFFQQEEGRIDLRVIPKKDFSVKDELKIYNEVKKKLGDGFKLDIKLTEKINLTPSGKYRFLDQRLELKYGE